MGIDNKNNSDEPEKKKKKKGSGLAKLKKTLKRLKKLKKHLAKIKTYTVILIKLGPVIALIILIIVIASYLVILIPNSISSLFSETYETREDNPAYKDVSSDENIAADNNTIKDITVEDIRNNGFYVGSDYWYEDIHDILTNDTSIGFLDETDLLEGEEISDLKYDEEKGLDLVTLDNKKLLVHALRKAYELALKEAKDFCDKNDYSWQNSKNTLELTNSHSWEAVYADANYGDILSVLNMGYSNSENFGTNFGDFKADGFKEFILREDNLRYYYQIYYSNDSTGYDPTEGGTIPDNEITLSETQEAQYNEALEEYNNAVNAGEENVTAPTRAQFASQKTCTITITPYTLTTLYKMIGVNPEDTYIPGVTYEEWRKEQMIVLKEITGDISDEMGYENVTPFTRNINATPINVTVNQFDVINGDNAKTVWNALRANGYSRSAAAGIMGNIKAESGFNINALSSDGHDSYGICQWTYDRKTKLLARPGYDTIEVQASFLIEEIPGRMGQFNHILSTVLDSIDGVNEACDWFAWKFESPCNFATLTDKYNSSNCSTYSDDRFLPQSEYTGRYLLDVGRRRGYAQAFFNDIENYQ